MLFIVSPHYRSSDITALTKTAIALGWDVFDKSYQVPDRFRGSEGAPYGDLFFCEIVSEKLGWRLTRNPINWLATLPKEYTGRDIYICKYSEALQLTEPKFIKPPDDKFFEGDVYENGSKLKDLSIFHNKDVIVSDPMTFTSKYRCFTKNRKVTTACCYYLKHTNLPTPEINIRQNYSHNNNDVISYVNKMLSDPNVFCAPGTVIDIGRYKKDTYAVIGGKPAHSAEIYGCEKTAVLDAIRSSCFMGKV
jgi:hypothetical protein